MSTLKKAKATIESEISDLEGRLRLLKMSIAHLDTVIKQSDAPQKRGASVAAVKTVAKHVKTAPKSAEPKKGGNGKMLPKTGEPFWLRFMSKEPKLAGDLFSSALAELSIKPTSDNAKILRQRLSVMLSNMAKRGTIKASGTGRSKLYSQAL